jgi:hypothetical protein
MKPVPYYVFAFAIAVPAVLVEIEMPAWLSLRSQILTLQYHLIPISPGRKASDPPPLLAAPEIRRCFPETGERDVQLHNLG